MSNNRPSSTTMILSLISLCSPLLIYLAVFYPVVFTVFSLARDYGKILAALAPILLLVICLAKSGRKNRS